MIAHVPCHPNPVLAMRDHSLFDKISGIRLTPLEVNQIKICSFNKLKYVDVNQSCDFKV